MLSAARWTREPRYEQMCHLLSHQRRLEAETPAMRRGQDHLRLRRGNTSCSGPAQQPEAETPEVRERCLVYLRLSQQCFYLIKTIKATNAVQMLYSISSSKLHHTSGQWCIVTSNFLLFNIIIMYCLSHNLLCSFTINFLHKKATISTPQHLYMPCICRHSTTDIIHLLYYKQLGRSRSPKMCCIHLVRINR